MFAAKEISGSRFVYPVEYFSCRVITHLCQYVNLTPLNAPRTTCCQALRRNLQVA